VRQLAGGREGRGRGEEPNHTTGRKPGPLLNVQYFLRSNFMFLQIVSEVLTNVFFFSINYLLTEIRSEFLDLQE
jgi:hypothetical protein